MSHRLISLCSFPCLLFSSLLSSSTSPLQGTHSTTRASVWAWMRWRWWRITDVTQRSSNSYLRPSCLLIRHTWWRMCTAGGTGGVGVGREQVWGEVQGGGAWICTSHSFLPSGKNTKGSLLHQLITQAGERGVRLKEDGYPLALKRLSTLYWTNALYWDGIWIDFFFFFVCSAVPMRFVCRLHITHVHQNWKRAVNQSLGWMVGLLGFQSQGDL